MKKAVIIACVGAAAADRHVEIVTSDLSGGTSNRVFDNIKGRWSQSLNFLGSEAKIDAKYDRNARKDFLSEATLRGHIDDVKYEVKTHFDDNHELKLNANTKDGTGLEVVADTKNGLTKVAASRKGVMIQGQDCALEASHERMSGDSKLKLSSVLGHGVSGSAEWTVGSKLDAAEYELEYETELSAGRQVSANLNPKDGSGSIKYVDTKTLDATITASMDLGGAPKLTLKRGWSF